MPAPSVGNKAPAQQQSPDYQQQSPDSSSEQQLPRAMGLTEAEVGQSWFGLHIIPVNSSFNMLRVFGLIRLQLI